MDLGLSDLVAWNLRHHSTAAQMPQMRHLPGQTLRGHVPPQLHHSMMPAQVSSDKSEPGAEPSAEPLSKRRRLEETAPVLPDLETGSTSDISRSPAEYSPPETQPQQQQERSPPSLSDLGEDLILKVLQSGHPTAWDLCRFSCVSRQWKQLCYSRVFWTKLRIGPGSMHPGVELLAPRCANLTDLYVDDPRCELHILHPIIVACSDSLRRIVIDCDRDATSRNEAAICSILWIISLYCKHVESVELTSHGVETSFGVLEARSMWYLTSGFRSMRQFSCLVRNSVTRQAVYLMVIGWRNLSCLRIHMGALEVDDLLALRKCSSLRVLELVGGSIHTLPAALAALPSATPAPVSTCPWLGSTRTSGSGAGSAAPDAFHPELEVLILTDVDFDAAVVATIALRCPNLRRIVIKGLCCAMCAAAGSAAAAAAAAGRVVATPAVGL
ncbi:hypothetical protein CLOM_g430 [Closterium sp. NIES-68]|nr:hypothetical protein CLOM_g430 [Closterium sp. NIES-68]